MYSSLRAGLVLVAILMAGCQRPAANPPKAPGRVQGASAIPPPATNDKSKAIDLAGWQKRWEAAATNEPVEGPRDAMPSLLRIQLHLPNADQRALLKELATSPVEQRFQLIKEILDGAAEAREGQRVPIEYACQTVVQGDAKTRDQFWLELLAPRLSPEKLKEVASEPAIRAAIELGLCDRVPGLTTAAVSLILKNAYSISASDKRSLKDELAKSALEQWLLEAAQQTPADEQSEVTTLLLGAPVVPAPRPPRIDAFNPVYIDKRDNRQRMLEAIRSRALFGQQPAKPSLTDDELTQLRSDKTPLPILIKLLQHPSFKPALLSVDEQRALVATLVAQTQRQPPLWASVLAILARHEMAMTPANRQALIATTRPQAGQSADYNTTFQAAQLFAQAPPEEITASFLEIIETDSHLKQQFLPTTFKRLTAEQAKELIRGLTPKIAMRDFTLLYAMMLLKNQLLPADGTKLEQYVVAQMKLYPLEKKAQPFPQDDRTKLAEALVFCDQLSPTTITEVLELTYGASDFNGDLQAALQSIGDRTLGGLLAKYQVPQRATWLERLTANLRNKNGVFVGRDALLAFEKIAATLSPEEAERFIPVIVESADHDAMYSVTNIILNRPANDRLIAMKALAKLLLQTKFQTEGSPYEGQATYQLIELACGALPPHQNTELAQYCLELRMTGRNHDYAANHLLAATVRRVQPKDQPAIGKWITQQLDSQLATYQLFALAAANEGMPHALNQSNKRKLTAEIIRRAIQVLNADPPRSDEPFEGGSIPVLKKVAELLPPLIQSLSVEDSRPGVESLIEPLTRHFQEPLFTRNDRVFTDNIADLMPVFASLPGEYSPAKMKRMSEVYLVYATWGRPNKAIQHDSLVRSLRGTLPSGEGSRLWQQVIDWQLDAAKYGSNVDQTKLYNCLGFLAEHLHPNDVRDCLQSLDSLWPDRTPQESTEPMPGVLAPPTRTLSDPLPPASVLRVCANLARTLPTEFAEAQFGALKAKSASAASPERVALYNSQAAAFLRPIASENPAKLFELLGTLKLDPNQHSMVIHFLADCQDDKTLADLILNQVKKGEPLDGAVVAQLSAAARLLVIDTLELEKNPKWPQYSTFVGHAGYVRPVELSQLKKLLREPDCVGLRRLTVHKLLPLTEQQLARWQTLQR